MSDTAEPIDNDVENSEFVLACLRRAVRLALRRHKLLGESVAVWRDGKVVVLRPDEIPDSDIATEEEVREHRRQLMRRYYPDAEI